MSIYLKLQQAISKDDISDTIFAELIYDIISQGHISEEQFRDEFGLSLDAVHRWTMAKNLPQPNVRSVILRWVLEQIS